MVVPIGMVRNTGVNGIKEREVNNYEKNYRNKGI